MKVVYAHISHLAFIGLVAQPSFPCSSFVRRPTSNAMVTFRLQFSPFSSPTPCHPHTRPSCFLPTVLSYLSHQSIGIGNSFTLVYFQYAKFDDIQYTQRDQVLSGKKIHLFDIIPCSLTLAAHQYKHCCVLSLRVGILH